MTPPMDGGGTWRLTCDRCDWYITVAVDSGTGERAAAMMNEHSLAEHDRPFPDWADR